jgi:hypothetical protein
MYLVINDAILPNFVGLVKKNKIKGACLQPRQDNVLVIIDKIILEENINPLQLKGIIIISEAESFSQSRIYVTIANILGIYFDLPRTFIKPQKDESIDQAIDRAKKKLNKKNILPVYNKEPNITKRAQ